MAQGSSGLNPLATARPSICWTMFSEINFSAQEPPSSAPAHPVHQPFLAASVHCAPALPGSVGEPIQCISPSWQRRRAVPRGASPRHAHTGADTFGERAQASSPENNSKDKPVFFTFTTNYTNLTIITDRPKNKCATSMAKNFQADFSQSSSSLSICSHTLGSVSDQPLFKKSRPN